jgi:tight adherence protein C
MSPLVLAVSVFVLVGIAGACFCASINQKSNALGDRFLDLGAKMRVTYGSVDSEQIQSEGMAHALFRWALEKVPEPKLDTPEVAKLGLTLTRAGYSGTRALHVFQFIRIASAVAITCSGLFLSIFLGWTGFRSIMAMIGGAALGAWLPLFQLGRMAKNRRGEIASQLSNVLDLLVVCVEAGLGINEAIKIVGAELERQGQVIGRELAMVSAELNAGTRLGQSLRHLAVRTNVEDIKPLAATMIQSEQLGSQMGPALRSMSESLRNSRRIRAEEAAQKTTVKILFPLIFFVLPAMMIVIVGPAMIQIMKAMSQSAAAGH